MSARAFTDEVVAKVEAHGVYRVGYPDRASAERLIQQLREAIAAERAAIAELIKAAREAGAIESGAHTARLNIALRAVGGA